MATSRQNRKERRKVESQNKNSNIKQFHPLTFKQGLMWKSLEENFITIALGSSGTGKTLTALHYGFKEIYNGNLDKIIYIRSDVGCDFQRGRGALKGDYKEKFAPLLNPVVDNLPLIFNNNGIIDYVLSKNKVEAVFLEDIRGRSFNRSMVIADEVQNVTKSQVKTILSRLGESSKCALIGDTSQIDLKVFKSDNGLADAYNRLKNINNIGRIKFSPEDCVRSGILHDILMAYEQEY